jgi:hypothetical protein
VRRDGIDSEIKPWIADTIGESAITCVRLTAEQRTREERLRGREIGSGFDYDVGASDAVTALIESHDPPAFPEQPRMGNRRYRLRGSAQGSGLVPPGLIV